MPQSVNNRVDLVSATEKGIISHSIDSGEIDLLKRLACILFLSLQSLHALSISVNVGKENGKEFSVAHIKELSAFACSSRIDEFDETKEIQCLLPREPQQNFEAIQSNFFTIDAWVKNKKYYVRILPKHKMQLFAVEQPLYEKNKLYGKDARKKASHWVVVGYEQNLPMIKPMTTHPNGINFPIEMAEVGRPSVGSLDVAGRPIKLEKIKDVSEYMRIKSAYEAGNLEDISRDVDDVFKQYPNTIFKAELLLFKIRGLHYLDENEDLLVTTKAFMRNYSDDPNMPEVLAYTANAYSNVGLQADGSYFYERLFSEFPDSKFAALGKIYLGDQFMGSGKLHTAKNYYENALYQTKDIEIASMAAIRLAKMSLEQGDLERANDLYMKVVEGNKKYLLHNIDKNYENARVFANRNYQKTGAAIMQGVADFMDRGDDRYEEILRDIGIWLAETDDKAGAYKALKKYLATFGEGNTYSQEVQRTLDGLFYAPEDANKSALIKEYADLEESYSNSDIGQKASLEKARLFYDTGRYEEVLAMPIPSEALAADFTQIRKKSALALAEKALDENACGKAMVISKEHNLSLDNTLDEKVYECAYQTGNYAKAHETAQRHIKDKASRLLWLYNYAKTLNQIGQYKEMTKVAQDVIALADADKTTKYDDVLKDAFEAYQRLDDSPGMVQTAKAIEKRHGVKYDDIEIYMAMVKLGVKEKDDVITLGYAKKVMALQEESKSYTQTPFVEFAAIQVYKNQKDDKAQKEILQGLLTQKLGPKDKARSLYLLGSIEMKEGRNKEAKAAFEESMATEQDSAWAKLSQDALKLLE